MRQRYRRWGDCERAELMGVGWKRSAVDDLTRRGNLPEMEKEWIELAVNAGETDFEYIMDQWLGCSVNLICAQEVVRMDSSINWTSKKSGAIQQAHSRVSPLNTGHHYERFCQAVELVAQRLDTHWTADKVEFALMSTGGKKPAPWRTYVVRKRLEDFVSPQIN